jgi:HPt (histidine-containing phosphotransfer) domain-containing protein
MATLVDPDFRARLRALNDKYAAAVPGLMQAIDAVLQDCIAQAAPAPPVARLVALHKALHTVAGSAATFGFPVLGNQCRQLEQQLRVLTSAPVDEAALVHAWPLLAADIGQLLRWAALDPQSDCYTPVAAA